MPARWLNILNRNERGYGARFFIRILLRRPQKKPGRQNTDIAPGEAEHTT